MSESWGLRAAVAFNEEIVACLQNGDQASEALRSVSMKIATPLVATSRLDKVLQYCRIWWGLNGKIAEALAPNASSRAER